MFRTAVPLHKDVEQDTPSQGILERTCPKHWHLQCFCFFAQHTAQGCLTSLEQDTLSRACIPSALANMPQNTVFFTALLPLCTAYCTRMFDVSGTRHGELRCRSSTPFTLLTVRKYGHLQYKLPCFAAAGRLGRGVPCSYGGSWGSGLGDQAEGRKGPGILGTHGNPLKISVTSRLGKHLSRPLPPYWGKLCHP